MIKYRLQFPARNYFVLAALMIIAMSIQAQNSLDRYILDGLATNQSIQQQDFLLQKNVFALQEAKTLFRPDIVFSTTYTKAAGGRTIDFPTGDLLNAAYTTLNQLTGISSFPQLKNERILLNPDNFYDAKFRTTMPVLNAELVYNKRIKQQQVDLQKTEVLLYKRELIKEIKTAYYKYLKANNATRIYQFHLELVQEALRVNTSLNRNDKVNRTAVLRSQNEVSKINALLTTANKTVESARYYFNFLLNRPLTDSILADDITTLPEQQNQQPANDVNQREELAKLKIAKKINDNQNGLAKSYLIPKIGSFLDLGSQAFDWKMNNRSRYYFFGISLEWNLISFGKNDARIKQTLADGQAITAQTNYVQQQLYTELKVRQADMQSSIAQYTAARSQLETSQTYYGDMLKLYKEGMAIYIELLDARNQWMDAQLYANIALYDTWIAYTAIERASASINLP